MTESRNYGESMKRYVIETCYGTVLIEVIGEPIVTMQVSQIEKLIRQHRRREAKYAKRPKA
jgi:hypothetical protein